MNRPEQGGDGHSAVSVLEMRDVSKTYGQEPDRVRALAGVDLSVRAGEMVAVMGPSGSGKSTLLTIAGSLEDPTSGEVLVCGMALAGMAPGRKARLRRRVIGYVFQDFNLLPGLTVAENAALPLELDGVAVPKARAAGLAALEALGVAGRASRFPDQLSGGERQRVAIARAVVGDRRLLLADEPSGSLDSVNAAEVMRLLHEACQRGVAAVVVTHDAQLAAWADRVVLLRDGRMTGQTTRPPGPESLLMPEEIRCDTALRDAPDLDAGAGSGIVARRAVFRWGWRLFRREWRQQLLVLGLLTLAVAATVWGTSVVTNVRLGNPNYATYGTAAAQVTLPGSDPHLAADIATIQRRWGPADVIENENIATGTTQSVQLRAESPHGHFNAPLLSLVSGTYPAGPGQVALTSQVATLYGAHVGGSWRAAGTTWRVTGIAQDPSNLADEFALVAPGQVRHPSQVIMLLGSAAARLATSNGDVTLPGVPAATLTVPTGSVGGFSRAVLILVLEVLGLGLIGLLSVTSFSVLAQRRLRAIGMLSAVGATERNLRLVMIVNGLVVGVAAALAGAAAGLAAWLAYAPTLQQATGHVVDPANLPWWAFAIGAVFAIATSVLASRRPAKTMAAVPVVAALSGRPAPPQPVHRSALPGVIVFALGLACLAFAGGLAGPPGGGQGRPPLFLLGGLVGTIAGIFLLAPVGISVLTAGAHPRVPVAIRIALRDLVRYRARSGAALAAVTFAMFLAMVICLVGSERFGNPLEPSGPNLSSSQLVVQAQYQNGGLARPLSSVQLASLSRRVNSLAASLHARSALPLESAAMLYQAGTPPDSNFTGSVYVATPQLLATYGINASQIAPGTDVLTSRPGLAGLRHMQMIWQSSGNGVPSCTPSNDCLASPVMQTISNLPSGTSAPSTVITEYAVGKYHLQTHLLGWLIQAPAPLTTTQINAARRLALPYGAPVETRIGGADLGEIADGATVLGIVIALGVLAASVGLIRSETARDLRTLTATGASGATRRMITAATAAALGLLGAVIGMAFAVVTGLVWAHGSLSALFGEVPLTDMLILLVGLPLVAAAGGWLLAGREPEVIARQSLD